MLAVLALLLLAVLRVVAERQARRWVAQAGRLGLIGTTPELLGGPFEAFSIALRITPRWGWSTIHIELRAAPGASVDPVGREALLALLRSRAPTTDPLAQHVLSHRRAVRAGRRALERLSGEPSALVCTLWGGAPSALEPTLRVLAWLALQLGLQPHAASTTQPQGLTSPDPQRRLRTLEALLGGWSPDARSLCSELDQGLLSLARRAAHDPDPWVRALGALHLGLEGVPTLQGIITDPGSPDALVVRALAGVWERLPTTTLIRLLDRDDEAIVRWAADALAQTRSPAALWALQQRRQRGLRHPHVDAAVDALEARLAHGARAPAQGGKR